MLQPYLATFIEKNQLDGVCWSFTYGNDLSRYPSLIFFFEPNPGAFAVNVFGHWPGWRVVLTVQVEIWLCNPNVNLRSLHCHFGGPPKLAEREGQWIHSRVYNKHCKIASAICSEMNVQHSTAHDALRGSSRTSRSRCMVNMARSDSE